MRTAGCRARGAPAVTVVASLLVGSLGGGAARGVAASGPQVVSLSPAAAGSVLPCPSPSPPLPSLLAIRAARCRVIKAALRPWTAGQPDSHHKKARRASTIHVDVDGTQRSSNAVHVSDHRTGCRLAGRSRQGLCLKGTTPADPSRPQPTPADHTASCCSVLTFVTGGGELLHGSHHAAV